MTSAEALDLAQHRVIPPSVWRNVLFLAPPRRFLLGELHDVGRVVPGDDARLGVAQPPLLPTLPGPAKDRRDDGDGPDAANVSLATYHSHRAQGLALFPRLATHLSSLAGMG
jgi:hypothetical protein